LGIIGIGVVQGLILWHFFHDTTTLKFGFVPAGFGLMLILISWIAARKTVVLPPPWVIFAIGSASASWILGDSVGHQFPDKFRPYIIVTYLIIFVLLFVWISWRRRKTVSMK